MEFLAPGPSTDLLKTQELADNMADLLGLNTIYNWIKHGRHEEIDIGHKKVDSKWGMLPKAVHQRQPHHGHKEYQHSTEV